MVKKTTNKTFVKGAIILMVFGILSKILGAVYRIPLTGIITAEGMGLYQMVFPLYTFMLTLSSSGFPASISKLISESLARNKYKQANKIMKVSLLLLAVFSLVCFLVVIIFAGLIAKVQGNPDVKICYYGLAPAIIFVGLLSAFKGFFQGYQNMIPSAMSGFIEQLFKLIFGLLFAMLFVNKGIEYGVFGAVLGISVSELITLLYLIISYYVYRKKQNSLLLSDLNNVDNNKTIVKQILSQSILVTLGGLIMPLTMLIDSSLVVNLLKGVNINTSKATSLFGLQTGVVGSIVNMPVVLSLAVATAILPCLSTFKTQNNRKEVVASASKAIFMTIIIALPSAVGCFALSKPIIMLLYGKSLTPEEIQISTSLLEVASCGIFFLALIQVSSGILQGVSRFWVPLISLASGSVIKIILNVLLVSMPRLNIMGAEIATIVCYAIVGIINLIFIFKEKLIKFDYRILFVFVLSGLIFFSRYIFDWFVNMNLNYYISLFITIFIVICVYFSILIVIYKKNLQKNKKVI